MRDQFPELECATIESLGSGWNNDAYLVDGEWVFRFPRRLSVAADLDSTHRFARLAADALRHTGVAVPAFVMMGAPSREFPYRFSGYRRIAGVPADRLEVTPSEAREIGRQLGGILSQLHAMPLDRARGDAVPVDREGARDWYEETLGITENLRGEETDIRAAVDWLLDSPQLPAPYAGPHRFLHNDICPDHVLLDPADRRIVGLLDLDDASLGDPVLDFVVLPPWLGWDAAVRALDTYELELDREFEERWAFMSRVLTLKWLSDTHRRGGDLEKHRAWVRRAFGPRPREVG